MTENTTELKIAALIEAWNVVTKQECNPLRFLNQGYTFLEAGVTPEEMTIVAKYMVRQNANASETKYKAPLNLYSLMINLAKFDSLLQLAKGIARNQVKPTAKAAFIDSLPVTMQTHGIKQADTGNTTLARQAVADGLRKLSNQIAKGN